jgi:hypothetical protein
MSESEQERSDAAKRGHHDDAQPAPAPAHEDRSKAAEDRSRNKDGEFEKQ